MENNLHAHIETYSVDCDGAITRAYVMTMSDEERADEFGDIDFHERVVNHIVNTYSILDGGRLDVDKVDGDVRMRWSEPTEEGSVSKEAILCTDDCGVVSSYRDHAAEAAGY